MRLVVISTLAMCIFPRPIDVQPPGIKLLKAELHFSLASLGFSNLQCFLAEACARFFDVLPPFLLGMLHSCMFCGISLLNDVRGAQASQLLLAACASAHIWRAFQRA